MVSTHGSVVLLIIFIYKFSPSDPQSGVRLFLREGYPAVDSAEQQHAHAGDKGPTVIINDILIKLNVNSSKF